MYAIAIHDRAARSVTLTRDPFGIKPLYTAQIAGGLAFASEPQALLAAGLVAARLRPAARDELLQLQFTTGAETIFEGIHRVLPGETLTCADGHVLEPHARSPPCPTAAPETIGEDAALARLDRALEESVDLHQRSDVPYGMFLSGGIDSASAARADGAAQQPAGAGLHRRLRRAGRRGRAGAGRRGRPRGRRAARDHRDHRGDGLAAPAGDRRLHGRPGRRLRHHPDLVPGPARAAGRQGGAVRRGRRRDLRRLRPLPQRDAALVAGRPGHAGARQFDRVDVLRTRPLGWRDGIAAAEARAAEGGRTRLAAAQAADVADWLPNDLLLKLDRCLMAHGVEGRTPFLDPGGRRRRLPRCPTR